MPSNLPDRYDPVPGLLELPGFLLRKLAPRGRRAVLAFGTVLLIALVAGAVFGLPAIRRGLRAQERADAHAAQVAAAARRVALTRESRPHFGRGPAAAGLQPAEALRARRALVTRLEASVLADARHRLRSEGPYLMARCTAVLERVDPRPPQDDLAVPIARLSCLAVERRSQGEWADAASCLGSRSAHVRTSGAGATPGARSRRRRVKASPVFRFRSRYQGVRNRLSASARRRQRLDDARAHCSFKGHGQEEQAAQDAYPCGTAAEARAGELQALGRSAQHQRAARRPQPALDPSPGPLGAKPGTWGASYSLTSGSAFSNASFACPEPLFSSG